MKIKTSILLLILLLILATNTIAQEKNANVEPIAKEIYAEVYSPFCPGRLLQDCPSSSANELKIQIKNDLASGQTKTEVIQALLEKYGKELGALPSVSGFSSLAWIIPIFFVLLGLVVIRSWLKANQRAADSRVAATDPQDQEQGHQNRP